MNERQTYNKEAHNNQHIFYQRTINLTNALFSQEEEKILDLGLDYAIERPITHNIRQTIVETEYAIQQLEENLRDRYRMMEHKKLKQILHNNKACSKT
jgi:hypothetical protein